METEALEWLTYSVSFKQNPSGVGQGWHRAGRDVGKWTPGWLSGERGTRMLPPQSAVGDSCYPDLRVRFPTGLKLCPQSTSVCVCFNAFVTVCELLTLVKTTGARRTLTPADSHPRLPSVSVSSLRLR